MCGGVEGSNNLWAGKAEGKISLDRYGAPLVLIGVSGELHSEFRIEESPIKLSNVSRACGESGCSVWRIQIGQGIAKVPRDGAIRVWRKYEYFVGMKTNLALQKNQKRVILAQSQVNTHGVHVIQFIQY